MHADNVTQVGDGVYAVRGSQVNWYLLCEDGQVTVVDAGYPGDTAALEASLHRVGHRPQDVAAFVITHAHTDHLGAVNHFHARYGTPALLDPAEVPHARREYLQQVSLGAVLARAWRPKVARWARHAVAAGGTAPVRVEHAGAFTPGGALDLPGRPVPVPTAGHTGGHSAFWLPQAGIVLTGDALVTGHPAAARGPGPQLLPAMFHHDRAGARAALTALEPLAADLVLPGHGRPWRGPVAEAVARARATA